MKNESSNIEMSERQQVAADLFDRLLDIKWPDTGRPLFNGPVNDVYKTTYGNRSAWSLMLMAARYWDVQVTIWSPTSLYVKAWGPYGSVSQMFKSADAVFDFFEARVK